MGDDIFESIADLEKRADEAVKHARQQAREFRAEVERKLAALAEELERDYGVKREEIERELAAQREQIFKKFEEELRTSLAKLDTVRQKKIQPLVEHVIKAFMENTNGD